MGRLIDADALIESIVNRTESETVLYNTTEELNAYLEGCAYKQNAIIDMINYSPTAYDVDKVVEELPDDVCEWRLCDGEANVYDTSCRNPHILIEGTPKENNYEYCPYCGKKIKIVGD